MNKNGVCLIVLAFVGLVILVSLSDIRDAYKAGIFAQSVLGKDIPLKTQYIDAKLFDGKSPLSIHVDKTEVNKYHQVYVEGVVFIDPRPGCVYDRISQKMFEGFTIYWNCNGESVQQMFEGLSLELEEDPDVIYYVFPNEVKEK